MITGLATVATSGKYSDLSGKPSLATVATSGSYNDLSNRPSIPSSPKAYITQTWSSGSSWYRKWSDGWIEQGGATSSGATSITLPVKFTNTNYLVVATQQTDHTWGCAIGIYGKTTTGFKKSSKNPNDTVANYACNWIALGF